jgi:hypothetical protein
VLCSICNSSNGTLSQDVANVELVFELMEGGELFERLLSKGPYKCVQSNAMQCNASQTPKHPCFAERLEPLSL